MKQQSSHLHLNIPTIVLSKEEDSSNSTSHNSNPKMGLTPHPDPENYPEIIITPRAETPAENTQNQIKLRIKIDGTDWPPKRMIFEKTFSVHEIIRVISQAHRFITAPEAYGICFPDSAEMEEWKKKQMRKNKKVGGFREEIRWLEESHCLSYYIEKNMLQDQDYLIYKVKNVYLTQLQMVRINIPYISGDVFTYEYGYTTTVEEAILEILKQKNIIIEEVGEWKLLLPFGKKGNNQKLLGIWLDYSRTLLSYVLHASPQQSSSASSSPKKPKLLVLCRNTINLKKVKKQTEEDEDEIWWADKLIRDKWSKFKPEVNMKNFEKFRLRVRKGIPGTLRGDIWPVLSGARDLKTPELYWTLVEREPDPGIAARIEKDLRRTFPSHPFFQTENGRDQLRNVLRAYSHLAPKEVGYCQGMNFIVGVLLLTMTEENAFWTLHAVMTNYGMRDFFGENVILLGTSLEQFDLSLKILAPDISGHFENENVFSSVFATRWLHTLFSCDSQISFVQRLWDVYFNEGYSIIFRTALAMVIEAKDILLNYDVTAIKDYFRITPQQIINPDIILNAAFKIPKTKFMHKVLTPDELAALTGKDGKKWIRKHKESLNQIYGGIYRSENLKQKRNFKSPHERHDAIETQFPPLPQLIKRFPPTPPSSPRGEIESPISPRLKGGLNSDGSETSQSSSRLPTRISPKSDTSGASSASNSQSNIQFNAQSNPPINTSSSTHPNIHTNTQSNNPFNISAISVPKKKEFENGILTRQTTTPHFKLSGVRSKAVLQKNNSTNNQMILSPPNTPNAASQNADHLKRSGLPRSLSFECHINAPDSVHSANYTQYSSGPPKHPPPPTPKQLAQPENNTSEKSNSPRIPNRPPPPIPRHASQKNIIHNHAVILPKLELNLKLSSIDQETEEEMENQVPDLPLSSKNNTGDRSSGADEFATPPPPEFYRRKSSIVPPTLISNSSQSLYKY